MGKVEWLCVECGFTLGKVLGGELHPSVPGEQMRTNGPNLVVTCPECKRVKVWYTADPIVRSVYQLTDAIASTAARAMVNEIGKKMHEK
jgi:ribosomal protein S27E